MTKLNNWNENGHSVNKEVNIVWHSLKKENKTNNITFVYGTNNQIIWGQNDRNDRKLEGNYNKLYYK